MQILGTTAINDRAQALAQAHAQTQAPTPSPPDPTGPLTSEQTFLQLLIAQIKNQDPLNPTDSIQFVGQLVQYSELEQLMGINQGVQTLDGSGTPKTSTQATTNETSRASSL